MRKAYTALNGESFVAIVTQRFPAYTYQLFPAMAEQGVSTVASALNKLSDDAFTASLSDRDRGSLTEPIEEYFFSASATDELENEEKEELGGLGM